MDSDQGGSDNKNDIDQVQQPLGPGKAQEEERQIDSAHRRQETEEILVNADLRDDAATARDVASDKREIAADLKAFLGRDESYAGLTQRRAAALDRSHAREDREASAQDRVELSKPDTHPDPADSCSETP